MAALAEILLIYGSSRGNTRLVAERLKRTLGWPLDLLEASDVADPGRLAGYRVLLFFASTWGDGELQPDMENLLVRVPLDLVGRHYAVCELGNYYGYDDFEFGALRVLQHHLDAAGGSELVPPLCMDSLPRKDLAGLERWTVTLDEALARLLPKDPA